MTTTMTTQTNEKKSAGKKARKGSPTNGANPPVQLLFEINKDRIAELFKAIHNKPGFIVDFDDVWPILNWSRKDHAVTKLTNENSGMASLYCEGNHKPRNEKNNFISVINSVREVRVAITTVLSSQDSDRTVT